MKQLFLPLLLSLCFISSAGVYGQINQQTQLKTNTILIVDNEGDGDFGTINAALENAIEGDTIQIYSGTYAEQIEINTHNLNIIGIDTELGMGNDSDFPIIDGNKNGNVISIYAENISLKNCIIYNSGSDIFDAGIALFSDQNIIEENGITGNHYGITTNNCSNNIIQDNYIVSNAMDGIFLVYTTNNLISKNQIKENNFQGIFLYDATSNQIQENIIFLNEKDGIQLRDNCKYNSISKNTIHSNNIDGIKLMESHNSDNKIMKNNIYSNGWNGIHVMDGTYNEFSENEITLNHFNGIHLGETNNNLIIRNTIQDNQEDGILFLFPSAQGNKIYYNNIINDNAYDNGQNSWDNGESGGNYWSYYNGEDDDNNGIGDTPYSISGNGNVDRYPLINPQYGPSTPSKPTGSFFGFINTIYTYSTSSTDSPHNTVQYGWDWNNDNVVDEWTKFYDPEETCTIEHSWSTEGTYLIKVKAMDNYGFQSDWSESLSISMPKQKNIIHQIILHHIEENMPLLYRFIQSLIS